MSNLGLPDNRPALAWLMDLPADWVTPTERLVLLALALDSYDGYTCGPGRDGVMRLAGIKYVSTFTRARDALARPTEHRPALIAVNALKGRHTRYQLLRDVRESQTGDVRNSQTGHAEMSAEDVRESQTGQQESNLSAEVVRESCPPELSAKPVRNSRTYPSLPLPTLREGERKEEALSAPALEGAGRTRPDVAEIRDLLTQVMPPAALNGIDCGNADLADALAQATAASWTVELMQAALADMSAAKKSATGQAITRLRALADKDPAAIILTAAATPTGRDVLTEQNQSAVQRFCKWSGADREALAAALADFEDQGLSIDYTLRDEHPLIAIEHPALGDLYLVRWQCNRNPRHSVSDDSENYNDLSVDLDGDCAKITTAEQRTLAELGKLDVDRYGGVLVTITPSVAALRRAVSVSLPLALAASDRPESARARSQAQRPDPLNADHRNPGPDGFGHIDPPNRAPVRPAGFDQAVRESDTSEKQRQADALAALDGLSDEQLAAALTPEQLQALRQHRDERSTA